MTNERLTLDLSTCAFPESKCTAIVGGKAGRGLTRVGWWRKRFRRTEKGGYARKEPVEGKAGSDLECISR